MRKPGATAGSIVKRGAAKRAVKPALKKGAAPAAVVSPSPIEKPDNKDISFPIIGMGASAGGLEAFELFFRKMPPNCGMAFVLVSHLDPGHASMLTEILQRNTSMPVVEALDQLKIEPDHVYVIPPNRDMSIFHGALHLSIPQTQRGQRMPIDLFLRSLADDQGEKSIGVILSGTGSDGTLGLRAIHGAGGVSFVQDPSTAKYDGMPGSAVKSGLATYVLPVEKIPQQLGVYVKSFFENKIRPAPPAPASTGALNKIFMRIRSLTGHDFSLYKRSTINRRIERRIAAHGIANINQYARPRTKASYMTPVWWMPAWTSSTAAGSNLNLFIIACSEKVGAQMTGRIKKFGHEVGHQRNLKGLMTVKFEDNKGNLSSRLLILIFVMAFTATVFIFPFISFACSPQPPTARENLVLGVYTGDFSSLIWVAENMGYFRDEGLDVTIKEFDTGAAAGRALLRGEVEVATGAEFVAVNNIFSDSSTRIISAIASIKSNDVIARRDHGIQNPVDLRNKKITVPRGSIAEFYLGKFLLLNKLTLSDVQIVYLQPAQLSEALIQGEVDAAVIWDPFAYNVKEALGQTGVVWTPTAGQNWCLVLLTGDATVNTHPGALEKLLRALFKAEDFIKKNPDRAQTIVAERLKLKMPYLQYAWSRTTYTLSLAQVLLLMMEDEARWMIQNKLTDKTAVPNYLNNIYMGGLLKVNPKAVSILR